MRSRKCLNFFLLFWVETWGGLNAIRIFGFRDKRVIFVWCIRVKRDCRWTIKGFITIKTFHKIPRLTSRAVSNISLLFCLMFMRHSWALLRVYSLNFFCSISNLEETFNKLKIFRRQRKIRETAHNFVEYFNEAKLLGLSARLLWLSTFFKKIWWNPV